ncbi:membrane protein [Fibrobacterales bacterium]|nr:membrane protein [Fibrobacterales bacterium]
MQQCEADSATIYSRIAKKIGEKNGEILENLAIDESHHEKIWAKYTGKKLKANWFHVNMSLFFAKLFGFTFMIKFLEKGETSAVVNYSKFIDQFPEVAQVRADEERHEKVLINMLDEERLKFVGSMVLGMNDALVELTGALAGFSFALQNTRMVALAGLITGISATLSMTASAYLSAKADGDPQAVKSSFYTGAMYLVTVALMTAPYLLFPKEMYLHALLTMFAVVVFIIAAFNYYISVAKDLKFKTRFFEMFGLCALVSVVSFAIAQLVKHFLGIEL